MYFRIHFDETNNYFVVQVLRMGVVWRTVKNLAFDTMDGAMEHVTRIGLNKLYKDKSAGKYHEYMAERHPTGFLEALR